MPYKDPEKRKAHNRDYRKKEREEFKKLREEKKNAQGNEICYFCQQPILKSSEVNDSEALIVHHLDGNHFNNAPRRV
jgi:hypothetical protein